MITLILSLAVYSQKAFAGVDLQSGFYSNTAEYLVNSPTFADGWYRDFSNPVEINIDEFEAGTLEVLSHTLSPSTLIALETPSHEFIPASDCSKGRFCKIFYIDSSYFSSGAARFTVTLSAQTQSTPHSVELTFYEDNVVSSKYAYLNQAMNTAYRKNLEGFRLKLRGDIAGIGDAATQKIRMLAIQDAVFAAATIAANPTDFYTVGYRALEASTELAIGIYDTSTEGAIEGAALDLASGFADLFIPPPDYVNVYWTIFNNFEQAGVYIGSIWKLASVENAITGAFMAEELVNRYVADQTLFEPRSNSGILVFADNYLLSELLAQNDCSFLSDFWGACTFESDYNQTEFINTFRAFQTIIENKTDLLAKGNLYNDVDGDGISNEIDEDPNDPNLPVPAIPNHRPIAVISTSQTFPINVNTQINLSGNSSYDPDSDPIVSYSWKLEQKPSGSTATLTGSSANVSFIPDAIGSYRISLEVSDGQESGSTEFFVTTQQGGAIYTTGPTIDVVGRTISGCGNVFNQAVVTVPAGEYWKDIEFIIDSNSDEFILLVDDTSWPTFDTDDQTKCNLYGVVGRNSFDADLRYEYNPSNGTVWETWGRNANPGDKLYISFGSKTDYSSYIDTVRIIKNQFFDNDGDGVSDTNDMFDSDPTEWADSDGDGVGDNADTFDNDASAWQDTDGDGCPNSINGTSTTGLLLDHFPSVTSLCIDSDGDNVDDRKLDMFPNNSMEWTDTDLDGIGDNSDHFPSDRSASLDTDRDGYPDSWNLGMSASDSSTGLTLDMFIDDPLEWSDFDLDGVGDNQDSFPSDPTEWKDSDADGIGDNADAAPENPARSTNSPPIMESIPEQVVWANITKQINLSIIDADSDVTSIELMNAPMFVRLFEGTISIQPTSSDAGSYKITVRVDDGFGGVDIRQFEMTVIVPTSCAETVNAVIAGNVIYSEKEACITSNSIITGPSVVVRTGADVLYKAPRITLGPGFRVESGADYRAGSTVNAAGYPASVK